MCADRYLFECVHFFHVISEEIWLGFVFFLQWKVPKEIRQGLEFLPDAEFKQAYVFVLIAKARHCMDLSVRIRIMWFFFFLKHITLALLHSVCFVTRHLYNDIL